MHGYFFLANISIRIGPWEDWVRGERPGLFHRKKKNHQEWERIPATLTSPNQIFLIKQMASVRWKAGKMPETTTYTVCTFWQKKKYCKLLENQCSSVVWWSFLMFSQISEGGWFTGCVPHRGHKHDHKEMLGLEKFTYHDGKIIFKANFLVK